MKGTNKALNPSRRYQKADEDLKHLESNDEFGKTLLEAIKKYGSKKEASKQIGVAEDWFEYYIQKAKAEGNKK